MDMLFQPACYHHRRHDSVNDHGIAAEYYFLLDAVGKNLPALSENAKRI